jgi:hypothetical protein
LRWQHAEGSAELEVDLKDRSGVVRVTGTDGVQQLMAL